MNNFNRKSVNHAYKHMILSITDSHNQFVLSLLTDKMTLINQQFATI